MDSVILAAPLGYELELASRLSRFGPPIKAEQGVLVVTDGRTRVYVRRDDGAGDDEGSDELRRVASAIVNPIFFTIEFSDVKLCREVLAAIADDLRVVVDNDRGVVLPGSEFVRILRSQPDWDWRLDAC